MVIYLYHINIITYITYIQIQKGYSIDIYDLIVISGKYRFQTSEGVNMSYVRRLQWPGSSGLLVIEHSCVAEMCIVDIHRGKYPNRDSTRILILSVSQKS